MARPQLRALVVLAVLWLLGAIVGRADAQAWLPPKGEASFSLGYGNVFVKDHYFGTDTVDDGHIRSGTFGLDLGYAVTNRLSIDAGIPYVSAKYMGDDPHIALDGTTIDNGAYHSTFQDFHLGARWQAARGPVVLTPYFNVIVPSHDYRFFAHSAAGRDLKELELGFFTARRLDPILDKAYVQIRYSYTFVQEVIDIPHNVSSADLTVGYFPGSALGVRGLLVYSYTHGGIQIPDGLVCYTDCGPSDPSPIWQHHDQISHDVFLNAGLSLDYAVTGAMDVSAAYFRGLWGENGHKVNQGLSLGVGWSFSPAQIYRRAKQGQGPRT